MWQVIFSSSWPGLTRPSIRRVSTRRNDSFARTDVRAMDGRLKGGHDEWVGS